MSNHCLDEECVDNEENNNAGQRLVVEDNFGKAEKGPLKFFFHRKIGNRQQTTKRVGDYQQKT